MNTQQLKDIATIVDEVGTLTIEAPKMGDDFYDKYEISSDRGVYAECGDENDAKFIIAFTPKVAIELIDALEAAERERDIALSSFCNERLRGDNLDRESQRLSDQLGTCDRERREWIKRAEKAEAEIARRDAAASKPVAWISERNLKILGKAFSVVVKHEPVMVRPVALYTTPPAASVPECEWTFDDGDYFWSSSCGEGWQFTDGGPEENRVKFCQGCGGLLRIAAAPAPENKE